MAAGIEIIQECRCTMWQHGCWVCFANFMKGKITKLFISQRVLRILINYNFVKGVVGLCNTFMFVIVYAFCKLLHLSLLSHTYSTSLTFVL
jgi:hypothetical protein